MSLNETKNSVTEDNNVNILQPGQSIKPNVSPEMAKQLIEQQFGYKANHIKELNSYDDNNYYVETSIIPENKSQGKFIFKILNSMDSQKTGHVEAENECMLFLGSQGFNCPIPQLNKNGKTFSTVTLPAVKGSDSENNVTSEITHNIIRLLTFVDGNILANIRLTRELLYDAGLYLSKLDNTLKNFSHHGLENHHSIWFLRSTPNLRQFIYIIEDTNHFNLVDSVLKEFVNKVVPEYSKLESGVIHGDFNEQNILVQSNLNDDPSTTNELFHVHGVIDFGDIQNSCYLFELAIFLCYLMLECVKVDDLDELEGAGIGLAGYTKNRKIPKLEMRLLRTCICARLCQSLVMGAYTYSQDVGNVYLLTTASRGWTLLNKLWNKTTDEQLINIWTNIIDNYQMIS